MKSEKKRREYTSKTLPSADNLHERNVEKKILGVNDVASASYGGLIGLNI